MDIPRKLEGRHVSVYALDVITIVLNIRVISTALKEYKVVTEVTQEKSVLLLFGTWRVGPMLSTT